MGCRASRRRSACVHVGGLRRLGQADERPWEVCEMLGTSRNDGVRLRQPSSRSYRRSSGDQKYFRSGAHLPNSKERYSAPPADRLFPLHSCTTAVYHHDCRCMSQITLRLSKNGSTLEIEKCDFQRCINSCQHCNLLETNQGSHNMDSPLRAVSAPNLSKLTIPQNCWSSPSVQQPQCRDQQVPVAYSYNSVSNGRKDSVQQTVAIGQLPSCASEYQTKFTDEKNHANHSPRINYKVADPCSVARHDQRVNISCEKAAKDQQVKCRPNVCDFTSQACSSSPQEGNILYDSTPETGPAYSVLSQSVDSSNMCNLQIHGIACSPHSTISLPNNQLIMGHSTNLADISHYNAKAADSMRSESDCSGCSDADLKTVTRVKTEDIMQDRPNCKPELELQDTGNIADGTSNGCRADVSDATAQSSFNFDTCTFPSCKDGRQGLKISKFGATDYRVRLLGCEDQKIPSCTIDNKVTRGSRITPTINICQIHDQVSNVCGCQLVFGKNDKMVTNNMTGTVAAASSGMILNSPSSIDSASRVAVCIDTMPKSDRESDESADTGCESEEDEILQGDDIELIPVYVHTDFRNDFGDLFNG